MVVTPSGLTFSCMILATNIGLISKAQQAVSRPIKIAPIFEHASRLPPRAAVGHVVDHSHSQRHVAGSGVAASVKKTKSQLGPKMSLSDESSNMGFGMVLDQAAMSSLRNELATIKQEIVLLRVMVADASNIAKLAAHDVSTHLAGKSTAMRSAHAYPHSPLVANGTINQVMDSLAQERTRLQLDIAKAKEETVHARRAAKEAFEQAERMRAKVRQQNRKPLMKNALLDTVDVFEDEERRFQRHQ
eukprot:TRINITY_DN76306_c0_g1_i1.p1 TRINITY_DN76306_c0_g1~~TRINITY_DN76306_c0_g1_i1.p1  ORF type:complete len:245 (-),score=34.78 TRINITY_DN76306_c0_g1_i1:91-825(-)